MKRRGASNLRFIGHSAYLFLRFYRRRKFLDSKNRWEYSDQAVILPTFRRSRLSPITQADKALGGRRGGGSATERPCPCTILHIDIEISRHKRNFSCLVASNFASVLELTLPHYEVSCVSDHQCKLKKLDKIRLV